MPVLQKMELTMGSSLLKRRFVYRYDEGCDAFLAKWGSDDKLQFSLDVLEAFGVGEGELGISTNGYSASVYIPKS